MCFGHPVAPGSEQYLGLREKILNGKVVQLEKI